MSLEHGKEIRCEAFQVLSAFNTGVKEVEPPRIILESLRAQWRFAAQLDRTGEATCDTAIGIL